MHTPMTVKRCSMHIVHILFTLLCICLLNQNSALGNEKRPEPLKVAYCDYLPFYFKGGNGEIRGIFVDFWKLWSEKTGIPVTFALMPWEETLQQVKEGNADINAGIFYTQKRDVFLDFSAPFFDISSYLFYRADIRPPPDINNLSGYKMGAVSGGFSIDYLGKKDIEAKQYINHERLTAAAISGSIDAFIMEAPIATTYLAKLNGLKQIKKLEIPVYTQQYRAAVREKNKELLTFINEGISKITPRDIDRIVSNWTGTMPPAPADKTVKKLVIAASVDQAPFHFVDEDGQVAGMLIDLWRLWGEKNGIALEFTTGVWSESLQMVKDGRADIHAGCFYSKERDKYLDYAAPLKGCNTHFFFHQSIFGLKNIGDLIGFKIGVLKNDYAVDFIRQELAGAYIAEYPSNQALFDGVEDGEIRVFVGDTPTALFFLAKKGLLSQYRHHPATPLYSNTYFGAVKEGRTSLVTQINKGFEAITVEERAAIERHWTGSSEYKTEDVIIIACDKAYPPFSMLDSQGNPSGMFIDFWRLWAQKTGKKIEFRVFDRFDALDRVAAGKADVQGGLPSKMAQDNSFAFSRPYYRLGFHLFYRLGKNINGMGDLEGQRFAIVRDTPTASWIKKQLPAAQAEVYNSEEEMIQAALNREVDIFAGPLHVILSLLNRHGHLGEFRYLTTPLFTREVSGGVKKSNQELLKILNAGMGAISHEEMVDIESAWIPDKTLRYYQVDSRHISLSENEQKWIQDHQHIRLGVPPNFQPFDFMDKNGIHMGIASDYVKILNERLGIHIKVVPDLTWSQVMSKAKAGKRGLDMVSSAARTDDMEAYMLFTAPYTSSPWVIITRRDTPLIGSLRDLYGKKIAVIKDYAMHKRLLQDHPGIPLVLTDSESKGLEAVSLGIADAYVGNLASASYRIQSKNLANLKIAAPTSYRNEDISFAVRNDWPELVSIMNKGMASISFPERDRIRQKWFSVRFEYGIDRPYLINILLIAGTVGGMLFILFFLWNRQMHKARNAAQAANSAKSEFLANLSHEIRTPMNVIMGMTDITLAGNLAPPQKENLKTAREAAGHLLELIDDILDMSKIEAGKIKVVHTSFDLDRLLHGIITTYTRQAREKGLALEFQKPPEVPAWVKGDPIRLRQILVNLIGNAIKFTEAGVVRIRVSAGEKEEQDKEAGWNDLCFEIQDTGIGIAADKLDIIFDSFSRVEGAHGEKYGGTGLGLAICRKFAELMGGKIQVRSDKDKGSSFSFTVPFEITSPPSEDTALDQETEHSRLQQGLHILLAEDSGPNAAVAAHFLQEMGHSVVTAATGKEVLAKLVEQPFDCILMDVGMPEIDGLEATRRIRNGEAGRKNQSLPIVAVTAHALDEYRRKCREAGMNDFLSKPLEFMQLKNVISRNVHGVEKKELHPQASLRPDDVDKTEVQCSLLLDREGALRRLGNNEILLEEIYTIFLSETPSIMENLREAVLKKDMEAIFFSAHNLKSASDRIGANSCRDLAGKLEVKATNKDLDNMDFLTQALFAELEAVMGLIKNETLS